MAELNHTIVWCSDKQRSADFLTTILGCPSARPVSHFLIVELDNGVSLDFLQKEGRVSRQHYAFLVSDDEFDSAFDRMKGQGLQYWADPALSLSNEINHRFGGRGVYFADPDGHVLELMTRPYSDETPE